MGTFNCSVRLTSFDGEKSVDVEALVDTGASYSVFPASVLADLGVSPGERSEFEHGDGRRAELDSGQHWITVDGRSTVTWSIFGEDESTFLLGSYALEGVRLGVDPYSQRLIPIIGLIK
jgi:predicted aspartyl protease